MFFFFRGLGPIFFSLPIQVFFCFNILFTLNRPSARRVGKKFFYFDPFLIQKNVYFFFFRLKLVPMLLSTLRISPHLRPLFCPPPISPSQGTRPMRCALFCRHGPASPLFGRAFLSPVICSFSGARFKLFRLLAPDQKVWLPSSNVFSHGSPVFCGSLHWSPLAEMSSSLLSKLGSIVNPTESAPFF